MSFTVNANLGRTIFHAAAKDGSAVVFRPEGPLYIVDNDGGLHPTGETSRSASAGEARASKRNIERLPSGGLSARLFVGLNVGTKPTYTIEDVVKDTIKIRKKQKALPDASFLAQRGVYTQGKTLVEENSVQIIIIDTTGTPRPEFERKLKTLGVQLRKHFHQDSVILEIQKGGVTQATYSIGAEKP